MYEPEGRGGEGRGGKHSGRTLNPAPKGREESTLGPAAGVLKWQGWGRAAAARQAPPAAPLAAAPPVVGDRAKEGLRGGGEGGATLGVCTLPSHPETDFCIPNDRRKPHDHPSDWPPGSPTSTTSPFRVLEPSFLFVQLR